MEFIVIEKVPVCAACGAPSRFHRLTDTNGQPTGSYLEHCTSSRPAKAGEKHVFRTVTRQEYEAMIWN